MEKLIQFVFFVCRKKFCNNSHSFYLEQFIRKEFCRHGIAIDGSNPWDIQVHDPRFFSTVAFNPEIGIVESYVDGWWTPNNFTAFLTKLVSEWACLTKCLTGNSKPSCFQTVSYLYRNARKKSAVFNGIKLCVAVLNWAQCSTDACKQEHYLEINQSRRVKHKSMEDAEKNRSISYGLKFRKGKYSLENNTRSNNAPLFIEDLRNMGIHDSTSVDKMIDHFQECQSHKNNDKFCKMWLFYLYAVAAAFRAHKL